MWDVNPFWAVFAGYFDLYIAELHIYATELLINIPTGGRIFQQDVEKQGVAC